VVESGKHLFLPYFGQYELLVFLKKKAFKF